MDSIELRKKAEMNLAFILDRAIESQGRIAQEDAAAGSFFCRVIEAETVGSPYAGAGFLPLKNWDGELAHAAGALSHS